MRRIASWISVAATFGFASVAHAATIFQISGGGDGHGIGLSQYGAYGYALHGESYRFILAHYYRGTVLGSTDPGQTVRVLLATGVASVSGATRASGDPASGGASPGVVGSRGATRTLTPGGTYSIRARADGTLVLLNASGKRVGLFSSPLTVSGPGPLDLAGHGSYRGALEFRVVGGAVQTVDAVGLDDYVRGVVSAEMPSSWAPAALAAQAVAARTYAITSNVGGAGFQLYPDTRSQMYGGVAAETAATDAAVLATRGQIVTYNGAPATTFFFSSSGGHTENIENVWIGSSPQPWLRGVRDPYDGAGADPYHRWSDPMTMAAAARKLGSLVKGRFRGIRVIARGVSPRVITAEVVGTGGQTSVTGPQLQSAFGLMSTYMRFRTISSRAGLPPPTVHPALARAPLEAVQAALRALLGAPRGLQGSVFPADAGKLATVQVRARHGWRALRGLRLGRGGSYAIGLARPGSYRIVYAGVAGPAVRIG
jgi:stage II sporulation protein D